MKQTLPIWVPSSPKSLYSPTFLLIAMEKSNETRGGALPMEWSKAGKRFVCPVLAGWFPIKKT